jgi:predicted  nucleic acid-binding Zn-ribbon protein
MAGEPDDLTIRILREIQASLVGHDARFQQIDGRFEQIDSRFEQIDSRFVELEQRMDSRFERMQTQIDHRFDRVDRELTDLLDSTIKASGAASVGLVRHENVQRQFAEMELELRDLRTRLKRLEEKV